MASLTWFVVVPEADANESASGKEQVDFREQYQPGTAEYKAAIAGEPFNDPNLGQTVVKWKGPFATEAEAKAAQNPQPSPENPVTGAADALGIANPLSGVAAIGAALAKITGYLGDVSMWRSLGWLLLGAAMIIIGILLWLKKENYIPGVVPVPVP